MTFPSIIVLVFAGLLLLLCIGGLVLDYLTARREVQRAAEAALARADLERAEALLRGELRLAGLQARRLLIKASYEYATHLNDTDDEDSRR